MSINETFIDRHLENLREKQDSSPLSPEERNLLNNPENDVNYEHLAMTECEGEFNNRVRKLMIALYKHCQYKDPQTGKFCGSEWHLQVNYIHQNLAGEMNRLDNYRLLCTTHNQLKYKNDISARKITEAPF